MILLGQEPGWTALGAHGGSPTTAQNISAYNYQDGAALGLSGSTVTITCTLTFKWVHRASYRLPKGFKLVVYGLNLTNEVFGFYNAAVSGRFSVNTTGTPSARGCAGIYRALTLA